MPDLVPQNNSKQPLHITSAAAIIYPHNTCERSVEPYLPILLFFFVAGTVGLALNLMSRFLGPRRPSAVKTEAYECGVPTAVSRHGRREKMSIKYYVTALLFILFDVEAVFLFLWAKVFRALGWFGIVEMFIFLLVAHLRLYLCAQKRSIGMGITTAELLELALAMGKIILLTVMLVQIPPIMIWVERRGPALMQRRRGPNRVGLFKWRLWGLLQSLADAIKLIFKEEIVPAGAHKQLFQLAPLLGVIPAFSLPAAIPFGPTLNVAGLTIPLSVVQLDVGFLYILAISSLGVYSIAVAGWAATASIPCSGSCEPRHR